MLPAAAMPMPSTFKLPERRTIFAGYTKFPPGSVAVLVLAYNA